MRTYLILSSIVLLVCQAVLGQENSPCQKGTYEIVKPFLGKWKEYRVTDSTEVYLGELQMELTVNDCAITQEFTSADSDFTYKSFGFVRPSSQIWEDIYVFSTGQYAKYQWVVDGDTLYTKRTEASRTVDYTYRLLYTNITQNQYEVVLQKSFDGGKTWEATGRTRIKRI